MTEPALAAPVGAASAVPPHAPPAVPVPPPEVAEFHRAFVEFTRTLAPHKHRMSLSLRKLSRFTDTHLLELSTDIYDELQRRRAPSASPREHLAHRADIHHKRNDARYKLGDLSDQRFGDMCRDLIAEHERRYPDLARQRDDLLETASHRSATESHAESHAESHTDSHASSAAWTFESDMSHAHGQSASHLAVPLAAEPPTKSHSEPPKQLVATSVVPTKSTMAMSDDEDQDDGDAFDEGDKHLRAGSAHGRNLSAATAGTAEASLTSDVEYEDFGMSAEPSPVKARMAAASANQVGTHARGASSVSYASYSSHLKHYEDSSAPTSAGDGLDAPASRGVLQRHPTDSFHFNDSDGAEGNTPTPRSPALAHESPELPGLRNTSESSQKVATPLSTPAPLVVGNKIPRSSDTPTPQAGLPVATAAADKDEQIEQLMKECARLDATVGQLEDQVRELEQLNTETVAENARLHDLLQETEQSRLAAVIAHESAVKGHTDDIEAERQKSEALKQIIETQEREISAVPQADAAGLATRYEMLLREHTNLKEELASRKQQASSQLRDGAAAPAGAAGAVDAAAGLAAAASTAEHEKLVSKHGELERQHSQLKKQLTEQQQVTDQVRQEAYMFLEDMRTQMRENNPHNRNMGELEDRVHALTLETQEWKSRYSRAADELRKVKSSQRPSMIIPNALAVDGSGVTTPRGLVREASVQRFQHAVDELLVNARRGTTRVLDDLHEVVLSTRAIVQELAGHEDTFVSQTRLISRTANQLISVVRNFATSEGMLPLVLLDAACSDHAFSTVELLKVAGVRGETREFTQYRENNSATSLSSANTVPPPRQQIQFNAGFPGTASAGTSAGLQPSPTLAPERSRGSSTDPLQIAPGYTPGLGSAAVTLTPAGSGASGRRSSRSSSVSSRRFSHHLAEAIPEVIDDETAANSAAAMPPLPRSAPGSAGGSVAGPVPVQSPPPISAPSWARKDSTPPLRQSEFGRDATSPTSHASHAYSPLLAQTAEEPTPQIPSVSARRASRSGTPHSQAHALALASGYAQSASHATDGESSAFDMGSPTTSNGTSAMAAPVAPTAISASPVASPPAAAPETAALAPSVSAATARAALSPPASRVRHRAIPDIAPDSTIAELQGYLEEQTSEAVDLTQNLLSGIRDNRTVGEVRPLVHSIIAYVNKMIDATGSSMAQSDNWLLRDKGSFILQNLGDCSQRMDVLHEELAKLEPERHPTRQLKQRLAGVSYDMAKSTKELVKTVEEVSLKSELEQIDMVLDEH